MEEALRYVAAGFTALKVKIGFGVEDDVTVVNAVRDAVGPEVRIMVDANHAYDRAAALEVARRIHPASIDWFEEPLIPEEPARPGPLPAGVADPHIHGRSGVRALGLRRSPAPRSRRHRAAGLLCGRRHHGDAEDRRPGRCRPRALRPHVWGTGIGVAAALQMLAMIAPCPPALLPREPLLELDRTYNPLREELNLTPPAVGSGMVFTIPTAPGIGFEPDRRVLDTYRVTS